MTTYGELAIKEWREGKRVRGANVAKLLRADTNRASAAIESLRAKKRSTFNYIPMHEDYGLEYIGRIVRHLREMRVSARSYGRYDCTPIDYIVYRNMIKSIRSFRFDYGLPPALCDGKLWFDPTSKYLPSRHANYAKKRIKFFTHKTTLGTSSANPIIEMEQNRPHKGLWTAQMTPNLCWHFMFENLTDAVEFRLRYEFDTVPSAEDEGVAQPA